MITILCHEIIIPALTLNLNMPRSKITIIRNYLLMFSFSVVTLVGMLPFSVRVHN
jgi:hypothetical protein